MGLDMYLHRFSKPRADVKNLNKLSYEQLMDKGYLVIIKGEDMPANFSSIQPLAKEVEVDATYVNFAKIKEAYGIPDDAFVVGESYSQNEIGYTFHLPHDDSQHIVIPIDKFEQEFLFKKKTNAYCIRSERVAYWRKNYILQDAFHNACSVAIENCGYYPFNMDMWKVLEELDPQVYDELKDYKSSNSYVIAYHEWY